MSRVLSLVSYIPVMYISWIITCEMSVSALASAYSDERFKHGLHYTQGTALNDGNSLIPIIGTYLPVNTEHFCR